MRLEGAYSLILLLHIIIMEISRNFLLEIAVAGADGVPVIYWVRSNFFSGQLKSHNF